MRHGRHNPSAWYLRCGVGALACVGAFSLAQATWAAGVGQGAGAAAGGSPASPQPGTAVPLAQATPWPGYVIQGGAIPQGWQPQPIPYQTVAPDGRAVTMYYAPTYTFTYPIGPPVPVASPVNRQQAHPQPAYVPPSGNGWNYATQGAPPPTYALPPSTVARYQPPAYQYPATAPQLTGQQLVPPAAPLPQGPPVTTAPPPASVPWQGQPLAPPPGQWMPAGA